MIDAVKATPVLDEFIFGDQLLHARFSMAIELLAHIVIANPEAVTTVALSGALGQPQRVVRSLLASLNRSGLVYQDEKKRDAWYCPSSLNTITLAHIFRSVSETTLDSASSRKKKPEQQGLDTERAAARQSIDLLLMQATMAINQVVLQHLQSFDLGRLKALASSSALPAFSASVRAYTPEPC